MKAIVIYDNTGRIWSIIYGEEELPQGVQAMWVDIPDGARLESIDVTDPVHPQPVFAYLPESDIGRLQQQVADLTDRMDEVNPAESEPETLDDWKASKRTEVSDACEQTIYNGVSVTLLDSTTEHFALTEHDQINLFGKQAQLAAGVQELEYHADGQPCRYYSAADMQAIIAAAMWHVSYHTTYCNALNMWIAACGDVEDVQAISYGADVPEEYQSEVLKAYLKEIADMAAPEAGEESADAETETVEA